MALEGLTNNQEPSKPVMNKIEGITEQEAKLLQSILVFIRSFRPYDVLELKGDTDNKHKIIASLKTNYRQTFDL